MVGIARDTLMNQKAIVFFSTIFLGATHLARAANYVSTVLYPIASSNDFVDQPLYTSPNQNTVGYSAASSHALLWTASGVVDLNPTGLAGINNSLAIYADGT